MSAGKKGKAAEVLPPPASPAEAVERLSSWSRPWLIGVRHHSPALSAAMPALLEALRPERVLIEVPADLDEWIPWLGHPEAQAPLALSIGRPGGGLGFYPFADFSPELAAIRWGLERGVPVQAFDRPWGERDEEGPAQPTPAAEEGPAFDPEATLWDELVEDPAPGQGAEALRRAALLYGWAVRQRRPASVSDLAREAYMRSVLAATREERVVAVIGAFHGPALMEPAQPLPRARKGKGKGPSTALLPYAFELLDDRSGYPAGIRDPAFRQRIWSARLDPDRADEAVATCIAEVARHLRQAWLTAGVPDEREALRLARDLARLRGRRAPGHRELVEGLTTAMGQGEALGRGRVLARAMEAVMIGRQRGRLAAGTPRSGLGPTLEEQLRSLRLPGREAVDEVEVKLDPLRSDLDRRRHVALSQLGATGIPYGEPVEGNHSVGRAWSVRWTPSTDAMIELAGVWGPSLELAAEGALRHALRDARQKEQLDANLRLRLLRQAGEAGLLRLSRSWLRQLSAALPEEGRLEHLVAGVAWLDRVSAGQVPGLAADALPPAPREVWLEAALGSIDGLAGSKEPRDVLSLAHLSRLAGADTLRLRASLRGLAENGQPRIAGGASAVMLLLGILDARGLGEALASGFEMEGLSERLGGVFQVLGFLLEALPDLFEPVAARIEGDSDELFLRHLPELRAGFQDLPEPAISALMELIRDRLGDRVQAEVEDPEAMVAWALADSAGVATLQREGLWPFSALPDRGAPPKGGIPRSGGPRFSALDRWRLVLAREQARLMGASRQVAALLGQGDGAGDSADLSEAWPTVREWAGEIEAVFGREVREEVLERAAVEGQAQAILEMDPEEVRPSVELLQALLSLKGGLSEAQMSRLRQLARRITEQLAQALATRIRPALNGVDSPRPTRRPGGRLDLRRTISANRQHLERLPSGQVRILPQQLIFHSRSRRQMHWELFLVVDVSGSMEASVIYAALTASIFHALPALAVSFLTFSDKVADLSERVDDPLGLLLEVKVAGGTNIARGLRAARDRIKVPSRSIVVLISDFEEGGPMGTLLAEVRALAESGATLLGLAALDDKGQPRYSTSAAGQLVGAGMPVAALTPLELARWVAEKVR